MTSTEERNEQTDWETETGLAHDVDAWIANSKFGTRDEYARKVVETSGDQVTGLMFLCDLVDEAGEIMASQGWSVGSGWIPSEDGSEITHPKRNNVVGSSLYGQLQNRVVKELNVVMQGRGLPTQAKAWDGLGFHWMQEDHATVGGEIKPGLMPTLFLGEREEGTLAAKKSSPASKTTTSAAKKDKGTDEESALVVKLTKMVALFDNATDFQKAALQVSGVAADDKLMSDVLDEGPEGFWESRHA